MAVFSELFRVTTTLASFGQVLLYLPLAMDIAGKQAMLSLSLLLSCNFATYGTVYLITRNTRLKPVFAVVSALQPLAIPCLLLLTLNLYSADPNTFSHFVWRILTEAPTYWEWVLRTSSPLFTLLEGISTLLCVQAVGKFTIDRIHASRHPDALQIIFLIAAAGVYVISFYFLWEVSQVVLAKVVSRADRELQSYETVPDRLSSTLIGVAVTSILFLTGISFAAHKGNVLETSLMFSYVVFQIFHISSHPESYSANFLNIVMRSGQNGHPPLPPVLLQSISAISTLAWHVFGAGVEFVVAASSAVPLPVIVGLLYRVAVMYAASRIILAVKRASEGYRDPRTLSEEEPAARLMTIIITYARLILIAVYTHLLLLSNSGHQTFWRWLNVFLTIALWAVELQLGRSEETHWKTE